MKTNFLKWYSFAALAMLIIAFASCSKNEVDPNAPNPDQNKLSVYLTDGPGYFDSVLVNIQSIAVKIDTTQKWWEKNNDMLHPWKNWWHNCGNQDQHDNGTFWDTLKINPGTYNLLNFANGTDTLISSSNIKKGRIVAFKLKLGDDGNSLVKDGVVYPLHLLHGWNTVYVRVFGDNFQSVSSNHYKIWLDFDAGRSVVKVHNSEFYLRPFIRAYAVSNTGSVSGSVKPHEAFPVISVENETDTLYAIPGRDGRFMVRGLAEGTYNVYINASNGYMDSTVTNVVVTEGKSSKIGDITLHK